MDDMNKVRKALYMFVDLFGLTDWFEYKTVVRFMLTVKKNYRQVAYHNWTHGFHVANSIYSIVKSSPQIFKPLDNYSEPNYGLWYQIMGLTLWYQYYRTKYCDKMVCL